MPHIVMLKNNNSVEYGQHLGVLEKNTIFESGRDRYVKVKNSANEPTIEVEQVKLDLTPNSNGWSLAAPSCFYIEFN